MLTALAVAIPLAEALPEPAIPTIEWFASTRRGHLGGSLPPSRFVRWIASCRNEVLRVCSAPLHASLRAGRERASERSPGDYLQYWLAPNCAEAVLRWAPLRAAP